MTKIKNTKKGMAKKTLSMSLVVAMLATSNVPVWAAEFSDGSDASVATEAPAAETFSDDATKASATADTENTTPVVEDTTADVASESINGNEYKATFAAMTIDGNEVKDTTEWGKKLTTNVTIDTNSAISDASLHFAWTVDGDIFGNKADYSTASASASINLTGDMVGKKVALRAYAIKDDKVVWRSDSNAITVEAKDIAKYITKVEADDPEYTGEILKSVPKITTTEDGLKVTGNKLEDVEKIYNVGYDQNSNYIDVTEKPITITLTPKSSAYKGSVTTTYEIKPKKLNSGEYGGKMIATLKKTSVKYNGSSTGTGTMKVLKSDIELIDKETKADLSNYLAVDKNGYVNVTKNLNTFVSLIHGVPTTGNNKNYEITGGTADSEDGRRIQATNNIEIENRDLNTVVATIKPVKANGNKVASVDITYKDKDTNEILTIDNDVDVTIPTNAVNVGKYTVTITAKPGKKVTGSTTAELAIYATNIQDTTLKKNGTVTEESTTSSGKTTYKVKDNIKKYYTGEPVTFTTDEIGVPTTSQNAPLTDKDYEITYSNNTNAGTAKMFLIGKSSYENSIKEYSFNILKTPVSKIEANDYVDEIVNAKPEDYKAAMGLTVKAQVPGTNKILTLEEGKDYTVKYDIINNGTEVKASVTLNTSATANFDNSGNVTLEKKVNIVKATLKPENIKLRETSFTYNGQPVEPAFDVVVGGQILPGPGAKDSDDNDISAYTYNYTNNVNAGTATLTVKGTGDYKGTASVTYTIQSADASKLVGAIATQEYRGYSLHIPANKIDLTLGGKKIDVASNFTLTYGENKEVGEGTVTLTPKNNNFTGTKTLTFKICGEMLSTDPASGFKYVDKDGFTIDTNKKKFKYDGTEQTFAKTTLDNKTGKALTAGTDYEIKYVDNVYGQKGIDGSTSKQYAAVLAIAKGKFGGNLTSTTHSISVKDGVYTDAAGNKITNVFAIDFIEIEQETIDSSNVSVSNGTYAAGLPVKPSVKIVVKGRTLVEGTDYDLDVSANKDVINATAKNSLVVTIVPKNGYKKQDNTLVNLPWGIDKFNLANADVTVDGDKITVKCGKVEVPSNEYTVTKDAAANKVTVTATKDNKNYTGSKTVSAVVTDPTERPAAPMISSVKVVGNKATAILSGDSEGAAGYDYVISTDRDCITNKDYDSVNKNQVQTSTTFKYVQQGTYYAYCHAWKRDENGKKVFSDWSNAYPFVVSAITPDAPVITNVKVSGSTIKVTYKAAANATGYDVVLGTGSKKENGETRPYQYGNHKKLNLKEGTVTATFKNVPKGTWVVGMHAFNRTSEDGKKVFSPWSNLKKATVK